MQRLAESGHLTEFQASEVRQGKIEHLVVGDYLILDPVGKGGMGQVFKARHAVMNAKSRSSSCWRRRTARWTPASIERFQREVEAASKLSHPNIVSSLDAGRRGEVCYLVMEYVRGMNLASYVRENGPMTFRHALDCILQAAQGLEYAHRKGFVHRDIKPSNLLMTTEGQVKVLDLGLVRMNAYEDQSKQPPDSDEQLTRTGQLLGTVDFMAPEQAIDAHTSDGRADIYGLGCTLYYLLTGTPPFRRDNNSAMGRIIAHREMPIPAICEARSDVPASFEPVFQKMMAKQAGPALSDGFGVALRLETGASRPVDRRRHAVRDAVDGQHKVGTPAASLGMFVAASRGGALSPARLVPGQPASQTNNDAQTAAHGGGEAAIPDPNQPMELLSRIDLSKYVLTAKGLEARRGQAGGSRRLAEQAVLAN